MEQFTRREVLRILSLNPRQLGYWERLGLLEPRPGGREKIYRFDDLIALRTIKQLTERRVPAQQLRRALAALRKQLAEVKAPLTELRIQSDGRRLVVEHRGARLEPLSGQLLLNFDTRALDPRVRVLPERTPEEWFALGLSLEGSAAGRRRAIEAYRHVLEKCPQWVEAQLNLGTLLYEEGFPEEALACYRRAVALDPRNSLARFNLGSVFDELGQLTSAREELRAAVRLKPGYADAHYNLALVAEKLGAFAEARRHWRRYLELDPNSPWAQTARDRLQAPGHGPR